jgi:hypothetical protein
MGDQAAVKRDQETSKVPREGPTQNVQQKATGLEVEQRLVHLGCRVPR